MEPHRNIEHNSKKHIESYVKIYVSMLLCGSKMLVVYEAMQPGDVDITYADINKASALFGYKPATGLEEGIGKFIEWFKAEQQLHKNDKV